MSTPTIDVNQAFKTERENLIQSLKDGQADALRRASEYNAKIDERIENGTLVAIGGDRYEVRDPGSWDNGEIWTYRKVTPQAPALILPEDGLNRTATGEAALYTRVPAWHSLGNVRLKGVTDIREVMQLGGIDYEVAQAPVAFRRPMTVAEQEKEFELLGFRAPGDATRTIEVPGQFVNYRVDNGDPKGVVGKVYTPVQNVEAFEFLRDLGENGDVVWETAGETASGKVFVTMQLPDTLRIDADGINDEITPFVAALNSHDGNSPFRVVVTPWRIVCGNTERFAVRDAVTSWTVRHTTNATKKLEQARKTLGLSLKYYDRLVEEENLLAQRQATIDEVNALLADMWPREDKAEETTRTRMFNDRREESVREIYATEAKRVGETLYTVERALTGYMDNVARKEQTDPRLAAARATAILEGSDDKKKDQAHKLLMQRVA
jgi:phage/plasmid-like protein (TIGR03299 family)